jgi:WD40 repeat protein
MVRIWRVSKGGAIMEASLKDHKGPVNAIAVKNGGGDEAVTASSDGSCIVWDLTTHRCAAHLSGRAAPRARGPTELAGGGLEWEGGRLSAAR